MVSFPKDQTDQGGQHETGEHQGKSPFASTVLNEGRTSHFVQCSHVEEGAGGQGEYCPFDHKQEMARQILVNILSDYNSKRCGECKQTKNSECL